MGAVSVNSLKGIGCFVALSIASLTTVSTVAVGQQAEYKKCIQRGVHSNADIEACQRLDPNTFGAILGPDPEFTSTPARVNAFSSYASLAIVKECAARNLVYNSQDVTRFDEALDEYTKSIKIEKALIDRMNAYLVVIMRQSTISKKDCDQVGNNIKAVFPDLFASKIPGSTPTPSAPSPSLVPATEVNQRTMGMIVIYSVAKVCANANIIYSQDVINSMEGSIKNYINDNKVEKQVVDKIWSSTQNALTFKEITKGDCADLEPNVTALFHNLFTDKTEENPFSK